MTCMSGCVQLLYSLSRHTCSFLRSCSKRIGTASKAIGIDLYCVKMISAAKKAAHVARLCPRGFDDFPCSFRCSQRCLLVRLDVCLGQIERTWRRHVSRGARRES